MRTREDFKKNIEPILTETCYQVVEKLIDISENEVEMRANLCAVTIGFLRYIKDAEAKTGVWPKIKKVIIAEMNIPYEKSK